mmetsp:Transcript_46772/g.149269  ORF Transcript_46772/g.149269 Transcript_46772/m.149269 type:complete len:216 (-) Transcript_46772:332-979(-)
MGACLRMGATTRQVVVAPAADRRQRDEVETGSRILAEHRERPNGYPEVTRLSPSLLLGSLYDALDVGLLQKEGVTHCVNATMAVIPEDDHVRLDVHLEDDSEADIFQHFRKVSGFLGSASQGGGCALVHCEQGVSRSATLVTAFWMQERRWTAAEALRALKAARPIACPNDGFLGALVKWEATLFEGEACVRSTLATLQAICNRQRMSRRLEMLT